MLIRTFPYYTCQSTTIAPVNEQHTAIPIVNSFHQIAAETKTGILIRNDTADCIIQPDNLSSSADAIHILEQAQGCIGILVKGDIRGERQAMAAIRTLLFARFTQMHCLQSTKEDLQIYTADCSRWPELDSALEPEPEVLPRKGEDWEYRAWYACEEAKGDAICYRCGKKATHIQVGSCVWAHPCNHRLYQVGLNPSNLPRHPSI